MKERRGRIINITSVVGRDRQSRAGQLRRGQGRAAGLHQVPGPGRSLRAASPSMPWRPGFIDTDMTRALTEEQRAALLAQIPAGPARRGRGRRRGGAVSGLAAGRLHHRRDAARQRRHVHAVGASAPLAGAPQSRVASRRRSGTSAWQFRLKKQPLAPTLCRAGRRGVFPYNTAPAAAGSVGWRIAQSSHKDNR